MMVWSRVKVTSPLPAAAISKSVSHISSAPSSGSPSARKNSANRQCVISNSSASLSWRSISTVTSCSVISAMAACIAAHLRRGLPSTLVRMAANSCFVQNCSACWFGATRTLSPTHSIRTQALSAAAGTVMGYVPGTAWQSGRDRSVRKDIAPDQFCALYPRLRFRDRGRFLCFPLSRQFAQSPARKANWISGADLRCFPARGTWTFTIASLTMRQVYN
jgi:hypothetical protein